MLEPPVGAPFARVGNALCVRTVLGTIPGHSLSLFRRGERRKNLWYWTGWLRYWRISESWRKTKVLRNF